MWSPDRVLKFTKNRPAIGRRSRSSTNPETRRKFTAGTVKGHFVIYASDGERFMIPLEHLKSFLIQELLRISEEEFGSSCNSQITVPCDSNCMEYIVTLVQCGVTLDLEKAVLNYVTRSNISQQMP